LNTTSTFHGIPAALPDELMETLRGGREFRIERIVSRGHASPPGFWYDQDEGEWVILLSGAARILFEGEAEPVRMGPGDYLDIPAHCRHRLDWTDPDRDCVWLAVFYR